MTKKSRWQVIKSFGKSIVGLLVILGILASLLQIYGTVDFRSLLGLPLYSFLTAEIPLYYLVLFVTIFIVLYYAVTKLRNRYRRGILDDSDGRKMALLCQTPKTTNYLRQQYDHWVSRSSWGPHPTLEYYMKRLERQGFLRYVNGNWQVTPKALEYISKYHGK